MSQSKRLNPDEDQVLIDRLIQLINRTDEMHPIIGSKIVKFFNKKYEEGKLPLNKPFTEQKLRKLVNHIRNNGLLPIMASSNGYFLSTDPETIMKMVESLESRCEAIKQAADGLRSIAKKQRVKEKCNLGFQW